MKIFGGIVEFPTVFKAENKKMCGKQYDFLPVFVSTMFSSFSQEWTLFSSRKKF